MPFLRARRGFIVSATAEFRFNLRAMRDCYHGFTLVELLVVMAIISLLAAMLLPVLQKSMHTARVATCGNNMKQSLVSVNVYSGDYQDFIWNYGPGPHDHLDPEAGRQHYSLWYQNSSGSGTHSHEWHEGKAQSCYWRGILLQGKYATPAVLGCSISAPAGWNVSTGSNPVDNAADLARYPAFVYRGRAVSCDLDIDVYTGGNIAGSSWNPSEGPLLLKSAHRPSANTTRASKEVLFNCPVLVKPNASYTDNQQRQPHNSQAFKWWSEWPGFGVMGHPVAENVGWADCHVRYFDSHGTKFMYVNPTTGALTPSYNLSDI